MNRTIILNDVRTVPQTVRDELVAWTSGFAFTFLLFLGMAHFENFGTEEPPAEIEDLRMAALPYEPPPPPPKPVETTVAPATMLPFAGLEVAAADSPVSIAVVPPDLEALIPSTHTPPKALVPFGALHTEFKPRIDIESEVRHVFQESEVDQVPRAIVRAAPSVSREVRGRASTLRAVLLLVIDVKGRAESVRVVQSSGNERFDAIISQTVREGWVFSPAIRRGKKVRCLAQQAFRVNFSSGSPLELH